jgi:DNA-binding FrmR family transcriptional regulator
MMDAAVKKKARDRLKRVAGQIEGIRTMVDDDRYCVDVLLQIASAQAALGQIGKIVVRSHVETCLSDAVLSRKAVEQKQKVDELMDVLARHGCLGGR